MTINGSLLLSVPIVKPFSAENFQSPTKMDPENGGFSQKWGSINIIFYFQNPQKAYPCVEPRLLTYFAWRSVWEPRLWARGLTKNEIIAEPEEWYFTHMGRKKTLIRSGQNFALGRNYPCKFWNRSVNGFWRGEGSNFRLFHRLSQSSL